MASTTAGHVVSSLNFTYRHILRYNVCPVFPTQVRNYAARKGTRERARKAKVKKEVVKIGFRERLMLREKEAIKNLDIKSVKLDSSHKPVPVDDVYYAKFYRWKIYDFEEAIQYHRETHDSTMYDAPKAFINALVELDLTSHRKGKFLPEFVRIVAVPHLFNHGAIRTILAFYKTEEQKIAATAGGANLSLGPADIKKIKTGDISIKDYDYVIAHPDILPDLLPIRGLLKKRLPSAKTNTLGLNLEQLAKDFLCGVECIGKPHKHFPEYGTMNICFGTLDMNVNHLKENLSVILQDVNTVKQKQKSPFITRVRLGSPPSSELFQLNLEQFLPSETTSATVVEEEEDDAESAVIPNV